MLKHIRSLEFATAVCFLSMASTSSAISDENGLTEADVISRNLQRFPVSIWRSYVTKEDGAEWKGIRTTVASPDSPLHANWIQYTNASSVDQAIKLEKSASFDVPVARVEINPIKAGDECIWRGNSFVMRIGTTVVMISVDSTCSKTDMQRLVDMLLAP